MTTIEVDIIDPKVDKLLRNLADMNLISIREKPTLPLSKEIKRQKSATRVKANKEFLVYLKSWPGMSDTELKSIEEKRKHFDKWK